MYKAGFFFLWQFLVTFLDNKCSLTHAKPLIGDNIRQAKEDEFPFVVAISRIDSANASIFTVICIGTLVTKKDIISAEHCLENEQEQNIKIIGGSINITTGTMHPVLWWLTYDQWAAQNSIKIEFPKNDICIIRLINDADISPAPISYATNEHFNGLDATIATWTTSSTGQLSRIMEAATVTVLSHTICENVCSSFSEKKITIPERMMCSIAEPYAILSTGDSGGPLLYESTLIAINSGVYPAIQPDESSNSNSDRVNYHFGLNYYKNFISSVTGLPR